MAVPWRRRKGRPGTLRTASSADIAHLDGFVTTRSGVEGYLEPRTAVTETTLLLVAGTGEWTRRRVDGPDAATAFARGHAIPLYEVATVGYPKRMRQWNEQRKRAEAEAAGQSGPGAEQTGMGPE